MSNLDDLKKELEEIKQELENLPEDSRAYKALAAQKADLEAQLTGSGAIAQGEGAVALGEKAVKINGDGNIVSTGDTHIYAVDTSQASSESLETAYLNHLYESASQLALAGIDKHTARDAEARLNLSSVYTALLTLSPEENEERLKGKKGDFEDPILEEERRQAALKQLNRHPHLMLLGDPGSGKTTFVNFVVLCLSGAGLGKEPGLETLTAPLPQENTHRRQDEEPQPQPWEHNALMPVRVILRDFAARGLPSVKKKASAKHLWDFITTELEASALGDYAPHLRKHLLQTGGLLMLDGLDEVPEADQRRGQIKTVVEDFASSYPKCRILVTSRTYAYQKQDWQLNGFREAVLAPFSQGQIRQFVEHWYAHIAILRGLDETDAKGRAELLKRAIFASDRLQGLAERPLLLTLMASLHAWRGGTLPEKREELYADTVDLLLDWWESQRVVRDANGEISLIQPSLAEWLKVDRDKVRALLNELAYKAHVSRPDLKGTADITEADLISGLMRLSQNPDVRPGRLVEFLTARAGLLLPRGVGIYTFPHRTFQEYLAACHLTDHGYPDEVAELAREDPNRWREVCLLAGAKATRGGAFALWPLVDALCGVDASERGSAADFWGALLAGQALTENLSADEMSTANQAKRRRVRDWLVFTLETGTLPTVERVLAGNTLAALGDPRFDSEFWHLPVGESLGFVRIPEGKFIMGSNDKNRYARDNEMPQHEVDLPDFWMAKYPVTLAQFRVFVEQSGRKYEYWQYNLVDTHPVVAVTWHEALAYCGWLDEKLKAISAQQSAQVKDADTQKFWQGLADGNLRVTLPSEAEWEKAARGPSTGSGDGRVYPWGDEFSPRIANTIEIGIGTTSPVGAFTAGACPYGLQDMSGNVWEWTRSHYKRYPYPDDGKERQEREDLTAGEQVSRVVRGGAFNLNGDHARCAYRGLRTPDYWSLSFGFRVVVSRVLPSS